jgi:hypothetical protein
MSDVTSTHTDNTTYLSDTVVSPDAAAFLTGAQGAAPKAAPAIEKPAFRVPVPEDLKFFHWPSDINDFITKIRPNLVHYVRLHIKNEFRHDTDAPDRIISSFTIYILSNAPSRDNQPRWQLYSREKFPDQPYYKWFISQFGFAVRDYNTQMSRERVTEVGLDLSEEQQDDQGRSEFGRISVAKLYQLQFLEQRTIDPADSADRAELAEDIAGYLYHYQAHYRAAEETGWAANCYDLYQAKVAGKSAEEIAKSLKVSRSALGTWYGNLQAHLLKHFRERYAEIAGA